MFNTRQFQDSDGDYLLVVSGSKKDAPYLADWMKFKDHLRDMVNEQPGFANVFSTTNQNQVKLHGWCRLKTKDDAKNTLAKHYNWKGVMVHVWETSRNSGGFILMKCNCSLHFADVPPGGHSEGRCGISIETVMQLSGKAHVAPTTQHMTAHYGSPYVTYPQASGYNAAPVYESQPYSIPAYPTAPGYELPPHLPPAYPPAPVYQGSPYPTPAYSMTTNNLPVNLSGGAVLTEARSIFIRNLSRSCTHGDLVALLNTVGRVVHCTLYLEPTNGAFKGRATALFATTDEALHAVAALNGAKHHGMSLDVRMDADVTPVGRLAPMIVNGSNT